MSRTHSTGYGKALLKLTAFAGVLFLAVFFLGQHL